MTTNPFADGCARVIGHRGSPRRALENTFDSFDAAEADGADGFELDVRLTLDGEPVVFHDPEVRLSNRTVALAGLTIPDLLPLRVEKDGRSGPIHALRDVLARYGSAPVWLVELKSCPSPKPGLMEFRVAALITQLGLLGRATVLSFSPDILRRIREIAPDIRTCLNYDATTFRPAGHFWPDLPKGCGAIGPNVALVTEDLVREARAQDLAVHVWTVNDPAVAEKLASWGVSSIISDVPAEIGPAVRSRTGARAPLEVVQVATESPVTKERREREENS